VLVMIIRHVFGLLTKPREQWAAIREERSLRHGHPLEPGSRPGALGTMRMRSIATIATACLLLTIDAECVEPIERGRMLYENHCGRCHESTVHIREDRRARTLGEVAYQVKRWQKVLSLDWNEDDIDR
jgi:hypothetical protein